MTDCSRSSSGSSTPKGWSIDSGVLYHSFPNPSNLQRLGTVAIYHCKLLGVYLAIKHFGYFSKGRNFDILTDHKLLNIDRHSPRQVCHLDFISQFTTDLRHIQGIANVVADALSPLSVSNINTDHYSPIAANRPESGGTVPNFLLLSR